MIAGSIDVADERRPVRLDRSMLLHKCIRLTPWRSVAAAAAIGGTALFVRAGGVDAADELLTVARVSAVMIAAAAAAAIEDPCVAITSTTGIGRSTTAFVAAALTGALALVGFTVPMVLAASLAGAPSGLPLGGVLVELFAMLLVGWLLTAAIGRARGPAGAGRAAGATLMVAVLATLLTAQTIDWLWRGPDPDWRLIHARWSAIGLVAFSGLGWLLRDPAARRPLARSRLHTWRAPAVELGGYR